MNIRQNRNINNHDQKKEEKKPGTVDSLPELLMNFQTTPKKCTTSFCWEC